MSLGSRAASTGQPATAAADLIVVNGVLPGTAAAEAGTAATAGWANVAIAAGRILAVGGNMSWPGGPRNPRHRRRRRRRIAGHQRRPPALHRLRHGEVRLPRRRRGGGIQLAAGRGPAGGGRSRSGRLDPRPWLGRGGPRARRGAGAARTAPGHPGGRFRPDSGHQLLANQTAMTAAAVGQRPTAPRGRCHRSHPVRRTQRPVRRRRGGNDHRGPAAGSPPRPAHRRAEVPAPAARPGHHLPHRTGLGPGGKGTDRGRLHHRGAGTAGGPGRRRRTHRADQRVMLFAGTAASPPRRSAPAWPPACRTSIRIGASTRSCCASPGSRSSRTARPAAAPRG